MDEIAEIIQTLAGLLYQFGLWDASEQIFDAVVIGVNKPAAEVNPIVKGKSGDPVGREIAGDDGGDGYLPILEVVVFAAAVIGLQIIVRYDDNRARYPTAGLADLFVPVFGWADFKAVQPDVAIVSNQQGRQLESVLYVDVVIGDENQMFVENNFYCSLNLNPVHSL